MPLERLGFSTAKQQPAGTALIITYESSGTRFAISFVSASIRKDVLKLTMVNYRGMIKELKLTEKSHGIMTDGRGEFKLWAATEQEKMSGKRLMERYGVRV